MKYIENVYRHYMDYYRSGTAGAQSREYCNTPQNILLSI